MSGPTLDDLLGSVLDDLPADLVAPRLVPDLRSLARRMPPAPVAGLECRLDGEDRVDVACLLPRGDPALAWVAHHGAGASASTLRHLPSLCAAVLDPTGPMADVVDGVWVEVDGPGVARPPAPARVFVGTAPRTAGARRAGTDVVGALVAATAGGTLAAAASDGLRRAVDRLPSGATITQVGLALEPPVRAVRLCVAGVHPDDVVPYLHRVGWDHDGRELAAGARVLGDLGHEVLLALDVGAGAAGGVGARVGLEAHVAGARRPAPDRRWDPLLAWLVATGRCTGAARAGLARWSGVTRPVAGVGRTGADAVARLVGHRAELCLLRGLHHVKLDHEPGLPWRAKAYIGVVRQWTPRVPDLRPAPSPGRPPRTGPPHRAEPRSAPAPHARPRRTPAVDAWRGRAAEAVEAAVEHLALVEGASGWSDFELGDGTGTTWVTAYVGEALTHVPLDDARRLARRAWRVLGTGASERGWGYNPTVPPDADTTVWALRLAEAVGAPAEDVRRGREALDRHVRADGVATYADGDVLRAHLGTDDAAFDGWTAVHACVTAAAAELRCLDGRLDAALLALQAPDGTWPGYWWVGREYPTALATRALATRVLAARALAAGAPSAGAPGAGAVAGASPAGPRGVPHEHRAWVAGAAAGRRWSRERSAELLEDPVPGRTAFPLAWALVGATALWEPADDGVARRAGSADRLERAVVERLAALQLSDGSWPPSALLRVPGTAVARPDDVTDWVLQGRGTGAVTTDRGTFTTATVLRALAPYAAPGRVP